MIKFLSEIKEPRVSELGGKGYSLAVLINNGFNVPKGFVIITDAFFEYLKHNNLRSKIEELTFHVNEYNFQKKSKEIKNLILNGKVPEEIAFEIKKNLDLLKVNQVSIRSSAVSEDSLKTSFAGLYDTFLNVNTNSALIIETVKKCWASLFNERAIIYRLKKGISQLEGMGVIVQEMIPADFSGIVFTVHPTNNKAMLIEFARGIGDRVVSGKLTPDRVVIDRENFSIIEKRFKEKRTSIPEIILIELAKNCLRIEHVFNTPQDIEWCSSKNIIFFLQSRAITTLSLRPTEKKEEIKPILNGIGASPGIAKGKVKVILSPKDINKMNDGDILVTVMTNPLYVTAMQKAKAIVTDVGGMICHAAIVARELGIPCVVGTENATKILKDGMEVVVNGTEGKVYLSD